jgi:hypothetical protein
MDYGHENQRFLANLEEFFVFMHQSLLSPSENTRLCFLGATACPGDHLEVTVRLLVTIQLFVVQSLNVDWLYK